MIFTECSIPDCAKPRGKRMRLCWMHYARQRRLGSLESPPRVARSEWLRSVLEEGTRGGGECIEWPGALDPAGYARFRGIPAYHLVWEMAGRRRPERPDSLDHACHSPATCDGGTACAHRRCVNVDHLRIATPAEQSANQHHRSACESGFCLSGRHPWVTENIVINANGSRQCGPCRREYRREYERKRRANLRVEVAM